MVTTVAPKGKFLKEKHWVPSVGTGSPKPDLKLEAFSALQIGSSLSSEDPKNICHM